MQRSTAPLRFLNNSYQFRVKEQHRQLINTVCFNSFSFQTLFKVKQENGVYRREGFQEEVKYITDKRTLKGVRPAREVIVITVRTKSNEREKYW